VSQAPGSALEPVEESIGYVLKEVTAALRVAMESELRPEGLGVTQYSILELLRQRGALSNADLARGAFVTRQSMNEMLAGMTDRGLVVRARPTPSGRAGHATLSPAGRELAERASARVAGVERRMLAGLEGDARARLLDALRACLAGLGT
jgi:DNA-binding MarR family transcriptional regulator